MKIYLFLYRPTHMPTRDKLDAKLLLQLSGLNRSYQLRYPSPQPFIFTTIHMGVHSDMPTMDNRSPRRHTRTGLKTAVHVLHSTHRTTMAI